MSGTVLVGLQFGDEGKGKVVDYFAEKADMVVRFSGGANAGHTLVVNGKKTVLRLIPSGILQPHTICVLAQGMVIDPLVFQAELAALTDAGIVWQGRIVVSDSAHLIMPYHILEDKNREEAAGSQKIGTTLKGIGPCYEDKVGRRGIRIKDLENLPKAERRAWGRAHPDSVATYLANAAEIFKPFVKATSELINSYLKEGKNVLFEGAQGSLLDIDHGTYPFVTSSSSTAGGACTGSGVGPTRINKVVGVTKAYTTRVGEGPFDTEINTDIADYIRKAGNEFGSVTGRPRRIGWLDLPELKSACMINGIDELVLTKIDVLTGLLAVMIKTGSNEHGPEFISFHGWDKDISNAKSIDDLPKEVINILTFLESELQIPLALVSVGSGREQTIIRKPKLND